MGKLVLAMFVTVDGYIAGSEGEFIPPRWSADLQKHWADENLGNARHLLYGRKNFLFNRDFWSVAAQDPSSPAARMPHAATMNALPKTVCSKTLTGDPGWNSTIARGDDLERAIGDLKSSVAGDIYSFGGAGMAQSLLRANLVEEFRLMVLPILLGKGLPLFKPEFPRLELNLVANRTLDTGGVILHYRRAN